MERHLLTTWCYVTGRDLKYNETREKFSNPEERYVQRVYGSLDFSSANFVSGGGGCTLHLPP